MTGTDAWLGRKRFVDAGGARIAYVEFEGAGPPLLLLHGFTDSSRSFSLITSQTGGPSPHHRGPARPWRLGARP